MRACPCAARLEPPHVSDESADMDLHWPGASHRLMVAAGGAHPQYPHGAAGHDGTTAGGAAPDPGQGQPNQQQQPQQQQQARQAGADGGRGSSGNAASVAFRKSSGSHTQSSGLMPVPGQALSPPPCSRGDAPRPPKGSGAFGGLVWEIMGTAWPFDHVSVASQVCTPMR